MSDLRNMVLETLSQIDFKKDGLLQQESSVQDRNALSVSFIDERDFLNKQREKFVILFEGLLSPDAKNLEEKLELTLRFLQFQLAEIDKRLNEI